MDKCIEDKYDKDKHTEIRMLPGKMTIQRYIHDKFITEELYVNAESIIIEIPQIQGETTLKRLLHEYGFAYEAQELLSTFGNTGKVTEIRIWPGKVEIQKDIDNKLITEELYIYPTRIEIYIEQIKGRVTLEQLLHGYSFSYEVQKPFPTFRTITDKRIYLGSVKNKELEKIAEKFAEGLFEVTSSDLERRLILSRLDDLITELRTL